MLDDATLINQILDGDSLAFEQLVQRYEGFALALVLQYVDSIHDAQDIVQEAFLSVYIHLPSLADPSRFKPWFFQIAINHARMWLRSKNRRIQREEIISECSFNLPIEHQRFLESLAWNEIIEKAMNLLSPSDRTIATLYFFDDLICQEVADVLKLPIGTIKRRLHRIRKILGKEVRTMINEKGTLKYKVAIETLGGIATSIFEKGSKLPIQKTITFTTSKDKQDDLYIHLVEGDAEFASGCRDLGEYNIKGFSIAPKGTPQIAVTISVEKDGTLSLNAVEKPQEKRIIVESKNIDTPLVSVDTT
jgi:RNA polymerase sigma-70 factor (ECF subfamily)